MARLFSCVYFSPVGLKMSALTRPVIDCDWLPRCASSVSRSTEPDRGRIDGAGGLEVLELVVPLLLLGSVYVLEVTGAREGGVG